MKNRCKYVVKKSKLIIKSRFFLFTSRNNPIWEYGENNSMLQTIFAGLSTGLRSKMLAVVISSCT